MIIGLDDQTSPSNHPFPQATATQTRLQRDQCRAKRSPVLQPRQMGSRGQENNQDALVLGAHYAITEFRFKADPLVV